MPPPLPFPLLSAADAASGLPVLTARRLFHAVTAALPASDAASPCAVVLDDLSTVEGDVVGLLHQFKALCRRRGVWVVLLGHADVSSSLAPHMAQLYADVACTVTPLATGHSVDVHGELVVCAPGRRGVLPDRFHFKVRRVRLCVVCRVACSFHPRLCCGGGVHRSRTAAQRYFEPAKPGCDLPQSS